MVCCPAIKPHSTSQQTTIASTINWFQTEFGKIVMGYPAIGSNIKLGISPAVVHSSDFNETFAAVANTMSVWMRDMFMTAAPQLDTTEHCVVHIGIRWDFLALTMFLTLAECLFVCMTVWETHSLGLTPWKARHRYLGPWIEPCWANKTEGAMDSDMLYLFVREMVKLEGDPKSVELCEAYDKENSSHEEGPLLDEATVS